MKKHKILFVLMLCVSGCVQYPAPTEVEARRFRVLRVIDGDTFKIRYDGEITSVRLSLVDCAEDNEQGGDAATMATKELIDGKYVVISFTDPEHRKRDHYCRLLCSVRVRGPEGEDIDLEAELVSRGVATWR